MQTVGSMTGTSVPPGNIRGAPPPLCLRLHLRLPLPTDRCRILSLPLPPGLPGMLRCVWQRFKLRCMGCKWRILCLLAPAAACLFLPPPAGPKSTFSETAPHSQGVQSRGVSDTIATGVAAGPACSAGAAAASCQCCWPAEPVDSYIARCNRILPIPSSPGTVYRRCSVHCRRLGGRNGAVSRR